MALGNTKPNSRANYSSIFYFPRGDPGIEIQNQNTNYPMSTTPGAIYFVLCPNPRGNAALDAGTMDRTEGGSCLVAPSGTPTLRSTVDTQEVAVSTALLRGYSFHWGKQTYFVNTKVPYLKA